jgi:hypothetical protein
MKNNLKKLLQGATAMMVLAMLASGCQKMDRPAMGEYPTDSNPPGGPLNFYLAFDGTTNNPLMNAVDSIRASFPSENPLASIDGVSGKAVQGANKKFIKFAKPNDWATMAKSFSIAFWYKKNGQTQNNAGGNGPEYIASFRSNMGHWSNASLLVFLEGNNTAGQVKVMLAESTSSDAWFTWEGGQSMPGLFDNNWHHITLVYDQGTSAMTLYVDGVANPNKKTWGTHGAVKMNNDAITEVRIGAGPQNNIDSDDWLSSSFKGAIDQFRMYSSALTVPEIQALVTGKK